MKKKNHKSNQTHPAVTIVAHRGYSGKYPENTLLAYQAAYAHGARWMECDIQLSADLKPIVHHDETLTRMAGVALDIRSLKAKALRQYSAYYPQRFGTDFIGNPFCQLQELSAWMKNHKSVRMFVEIKQHSLEAFGIQNTMDAVYRAIKKVKKQCIIISFDPYVVDYAREKYGLLNGWVIPEWTAEVRQRADIMQPDFLFSSKTIMPEDATQWWSGQWQWANYNVDEVQEIPQWVAKGLTFIETNEVGDILKADNISRFEHE